MAETVRNCNGCEGRVILSSSLQLKGLIFYTGKCAPRKPPCKQELPQGDTRMLPRAQTAKVCTCGQLFCLKTSLGVKNYSYKLCHWTRSSREASSELPGRNSNEVTPFLFLLSLLWVWHGRVFWSMNAQMVLPAWNALPNVITVQDILLWFN